ncbi:MAG: ATPase V [Bacteroidaceae bacterium]|nr:ATPase V [Bacteroidaceae bacterium]
MITKMKKLTTMIFHGEYEQFLADLQRLGVVHVQPAQEGIVASDSSLQDELNHIKEVQEAIEMLKPMASPTPTEATGSVTAGEEALSNYSALIAQRKELNAEHQRIENILLEAKPWGEFEIEAISKLSDIGLEMAFYITTSRIFKKKQEEWSVDEHYIFPIQQIKGDTYFVAISHKNKTNVLDGATCVPHPVMTASECATQIEGIEKQTADIDAQLQAIATTHLVDLHALEAQLRSSVQLSKARLDTGHAAEDTVMIIEGWTPIQKEKEVVDFLHQSGVCYEMRDPVRTDNVPILLRNNAFTRMYEVLTEMYGMPDYNEFDPTPILAPFFTLFFSYCIADAGYGLVLILLGFLLKKKLGADMRGMMNLVITLGIATTVLGAIFGTFFGVNLVNVDLPEWMKGLMITGKVGDTVYDKTMLLSLIIGVIHIIIAMTVKAVKSTVLFGFKQSITAWSWLLLIVGFICVGGLNMLKVISTDVSTIAFYIVGGVAAVGIFLLNDLKRNPLVNIGAGLWDTYGMASGLLGDVLSYVRIYALGLAGGMLGGVFNQLALMTKGDSLLGWIPCILILVFGHTLNIAMSCLGAFVHPLRLNFVEYFKNSNYEGTGTAYSPLHIVK